MTTQPLTARPETTTGSPLARLVASPRRVARIAGVSYLAMFLLGIFANFVVKEGLVEPGNASATVANISGSIGLFRLGVISFFVIFVLDVVIALALYVVFRRVDGTVSLVTAGFRLAYSAILGVAIVSLVRVAQLLSGPVPVGSVQIGTQTMSALESFENTWLIGLVAFGLHLVLLGWLIVRSGFASRILGLVLIAAGVAYSLDTLAHFSMANYQDFEGLFQVVVAVPSMIGEGWLGLWLLRTKRLES
jgi:hypothetical protein